MLRSIKTILALILAFFSLAKAQSKTLTPDTRPQISVERGQLVARNVINGKVIWIFGEDLLSQIAVHNNFVFSLSKSKVLYAISALTGKVGWLMQLKHTNILDESKNWINKSLHFYGRELVLSFGNVAVVNANTGEKIYSVKNIDYSSFYGIYKSSLMIEWDASGALSFSGFTVYDLRANKEVWSRDNSPIMSFKGNIFFPSSDIVQHIDDPYAEEIDVINIQTGYTRSVYQKFAESGTMETVSGFLIRDGCGRALLVDSQDVKSVYHADAKYFYVKRKDDCGFFFWRFSWTENPVPEPTIILISK